MSFCPWRPQFSNADPKRYADDGQCCQTIFGERVQSWRCTRRATAKREHNGTAYGVCKTHSKETEDARRTAWEAKHAAESARATALWQEKARARALATACIEAIKRIAEGHNDARGLAQSVLASADTHPKGGDNLLAPFMGSAVPKADAQNLSHKPPHRADGKGPTNPTPSNVGPHTSKGAK